MSINGTKETPLYRVTSDKDGKFRIPVVAGDMVDVYANYGEKSIGHQKAAAGQEGIELAPRRVGGR